MKTKICKYCGEILKKSWKSCPNCGIQISESTPRELPENNPFQIRFKKPNKQLSTGNLRDGIKFDLLTGYIAIIFGILGLVFEYGLGVFLFYRQALWIILGIILAVLAMIFGGIPLIKRQINYKALGGLILGGVNMCLFILFMPLLWPRF